MSRGVRKLRRSALYCKMCETGVEQRRCPGSTAGKGGEGGLGEESKRLLLFESTVACGSVHHNAWLRLEQRWYPTACNCLASGHPAMLSHTWYVAGYSCTCGRATFPSPLHSQATPSVRCRYQPKHEMFNGGARESFRSGTGNRHPWQRKRV